MRERCHQTYQALSEQGYRVLAVAYRSIQQRAAYSAADERDLTLVGFLAFADPPVPDAQNVLAAMQRDGVQVKIITGDSEVVTRHVCNQVGLESEQVILGEDLESMSDAALGHVAETTNVFARVSPAQKTRILIALKQRGHVVGFMGDGINDAPSLHAADVGISVSTAVDVARDAADIILVEPGLRRAPQRNHRGTQSLRQRDEISVDGDQLQLRQHVQHGGRFAVSAVSAHAADADPAE